MRIEGPVNRRVLTFQCLFFYKKTINFLILHLDKSVCTSTFKNFELFSNLSSKGKKFEGGGGINSV